MIYFQDTAPTYYTTAVQVVAPVPRPVIRSNEPLANCPCPELHQDILLHNFLAQNGLASQIPTRVLVLQPKVTVLGLATASVATEVATATPARRAVPPASPSLEDEALAHAALRQKVNAHVAEKRKRLEKKLKQAREDCEAAKITLEMDDLLNPGP